MLWCAYRKCSHATNGKCAVDPTQTIRATLPLRLAQNQEMQLYSFLNSAPDGCEWRASDSSHFTPRKQPMVPTDKEAVWATDKQPLIVQPIA